MKKTKFLAPLALTAAIAAGGFIGGNTYAAGGLEDIRIVHDAGNGQYESCYLYTTSSNSAYTACDSSEGSFNTADNIITLGVLADNAYALNIDGTSQNPITIKATNDLDINISSYSDIILDLGENELSARTYANINNEGGTLTLKSGTFSSVFSKCNIVINGGTFNTLTETHATIDNLTINGGTYSSSKDIFLYGNMKVTGGVLSASNIIINANNTSLEISGGEVNLANGYSAISSSLENTTLTISGGKLNIKNSKNGIRLYRNSVINFNGGVTTIENAPTYAIVIEHAADAENDIKFATGMGIKEPHTYVFWTDDTFDAAYANQTGIVTNSKTVTIAEGYTVNKFKGWEIGTVDFDDDDSPVKVPDTGANSNEEGGNALAIFAASTFVVLGVFALAIALKIHAAGHFKFDK